MHMLVSRHMQAHALNMFSSLAQSTWFHSAFASFFQLSLNTKNKLSVSSHFPRTRCRLGKLFLWLFLSPRHKQALGCSDKTTLFPCCLVLGVHARNPLHLYLCPQIGVVAVPSNLVWQLPLLHTRCVRRLLSVLRHTDRTAGSCDGVRPSTEFPR